VASSEAARALANSHDFIWASAGVHPHEAATLDDAALLRIASLCGEERVVALGEIGLDYYYDLAAREVQKVAFERPLEVDLPVIIHSGDAAQDTLELVKKYRPRGIVHCFSGSAELAREYVSMGMYLGFTGVVTFANAKKPLEAAREVPLSQLLIETDCPYLAPVPFRGKRCDSTMLPYTAAALAAANGVETEVLIQATWKMRTGFTKFPFGNLLRRNDDAEGIPARVPSFPANSGAVRSQVSNFRFFSLFSRFFLLLAELGQKITASFPNVQ
ncbi:MAG: TatD family hydrolase, partial [Oscillospiraceae bacterium]